MVTLTLNFVTDYISYQTGFIKLEIPKDLITFNASLVPVFTYGDANTPYSYSTFTSNTTYYVFTFPNVCPGSAGSPCPVGTQFKLKVTGGKNP